LAVLGIGGERARLPARSRPALDRLGGRAALGNVTGEEQRIPLGQKGADRRVRTARQGAPGQVGALIDGRRTCSTSRDDRRPRGARLSRSRSSPSGAKTDYELVRLDKAKPTPTNSSSSRGCCGSPDVKLSDLKYEFTSELSDMGTLYDDVVRQLVPRPPRPPPLVATDRHRDRRSRRLPHVRRRGDHTFGLIRFAIVITGIVLLALGGTMPARRVGLG
jgi:hypothetical protein